MTALLESSEKGQTVLPSINAAIEEIAKVEQLVGDYNRQLKVNSEKYIFFIFLDNGKGD